MCIHLGLATYIYTHSCLIKLKNISPHFMDKLSISKTLCVMTSMHMHHEKIKDNHFNDKDKTSKIRAYRYLKV